MFRVPSYGIPNPPEQESGEFDELAYEVGSDAMLVYEWRLEQLLAAGWPDRDAVLIAYSLHIDLHVACSIVENGCDPGLARNILI
jgi:hypothetical protein